MAMTKGATKPECLYHSRSEDFISAIGCLRKALHFPRQLYKRAAMAVCTCRKETPGRMSLSELELYTVYQAPCDDQLFEVLEKDENYNADHRAARFVRYVLHCANMKNESAVRLVCMLKMALSGDFRLLEAETRKEDSSRAKQHAAEGGPKRWFNMHTFLQKRKRQAGGVTRSLELPMFGGLFHTLQTSENIGQNLRAIAIKYKPCVIEGDYAKTGEMMAHKIQKTFVKIWCRDLYFPKLSKELTEAAKLVQASSTEQFRNRHRMAMETRRCRLYMYKENVSKAYGKLDYSSAQLSDPYAVKENKWEDFSRKYQAEERVKLAPDAKKKAGRRCYNCLRNHEEVVQRDAKECKYHPGFVVAKKWSCCGQPAEDWSMKTLEHQATGCQVGHHEWRYQNKKFGERRTDASYCRQYLKHGSR